MSVAFSASGLVYGWCEAERMLAELGHELWIGDPAQIRASMVRKQ